MKCEIKQAHCLLCAEGGRDRRCVYSDGDVEDLSVEELRELSRRNPRVQTAEKGTPQVVRDQSLRRQRQALPDVAHAMDRPRRSKRLHQQQQAGVTTLLRKRNSGSGLNGFVLFRSHKKHCIVKNKEVSFGDYLQSLSTDKGASALGGENQKSVCRNGYPVSPAAKPKRMSNFYYTNLWKGLPCEKKEDYCEHAARMNNVRGRLL